MGESEGQAIPGAKDHGAAAPQGRHNVAREDLWDHLIGEEDADEVGGGGNRQRNHFEPVGPRQIGVFVLAVADSDLDLGVSEVESSSTAQVAVAQHGDCLVLESR